MPKSSHVVLLGLALVVACGDDSSGDADTEGPGTSTGDLSTSEGPTSTGSSTGQSSSTDASTTVATSEGDSSSSTSGGEQLAPRMSRYVETADGTRIAIDIWLPQAALDGEPVPTVMQMTRYWRAAQWALPMFDSSPEDAARYTDHGFAYVTVDARGSGASFGSRQGPWSAVEREDHGEVVDWLVEQGWSNGNVGAIGISYDGNTAAFLATSGRGAVKAVVPRFYDADAYDSPGIPGGVYNAGFVQAWAGLNGALDSGDVCALAPEEDCAQVQRVLLGPKWVDEDPKGTMAAEAMAEHADNLDVHEAALGITYRDDAFAGGASFADLSVLSQLDALERGGVAVYSWGSWLDAGTADSALNVFAGAEGSHRVILGAWNHGADEDADPYAAADAAVSPTEDEQHLDIIEFFQAHLSDDAALTPVREIRYYTLNEGTWRTTETWPPAEVGASTLYFGDGTLVAAAPPEGEATYAVDYTATTGPTNRWWTQLEGDVIYPDRAEEDAKLLTFTGEPLAGPTRITGHAEVTVHLSTTHSDGALFAYLEDVAPDGTVTYISEGQLRLLHRALEPDSPALHSFEAGDGQAVVPGEVMEVTVRLRPTSVRIDAGHRIRIALAGHDASNFARYPADGEPTWTVHHGGGLASRVVLPVAED